MNPKRAVLFSFILLYAAIVAFAPVLDRLILFPTTGRLNSGSALRSTIPFERGVLEIWKAKSRRARSEGGVDLHVLRFYGKAEMWGDRAVEVWGVNYPGYGGSTGPARLARIGPAALTAFDALKRETGDGPIVVFGASLGTTAALHIGAHRSVAALILHNPPALRPMILGQFGWWNLWLLAGPLAGENSRSARQRCQRKSLPCTRGFSPRRERQSGRAEVSGADRERLRRRKGDHQAAGFGA
jgi:pimeloyl-ACP methyl ester carboxylesterase